MEHLSTTSTSAYPHRPEEASFFRALSAWQAVRADHGVAALQWLDECARACDARRSEIEEAHLSSFRGQPGAREERLAASMRQERDTWRLLHALCREDLLLSSADDRRMSASPATPLDLTAEEIVRIHDEHDRTLRRRKCVLSWLEGNAKERVQFMDAGPTMPSSVWGATQQRLDSGTVPGATSSVVGALDPDAPIRAGWAPLDGVDEEDEVDLLLSVWQLIRAGEVDEAARLCADKGQLWRAVALRGGRLHAVTYVNDEEPLPGGESKRLESIGNPQRALWKSSCWELARHAHTAACKGAPSEQSTASLEAAIFAGLAGDCDTLLASPLCSEWEDRCWAYFVCMRESAVSGALARHADAQRAESALYPAAPVTAKPYEDQMREKTAQIAQLDETAVLNHLRESPLVSKYHLAQASLIVGAPNELQRMIETVLDPAQTRGAADERSPEFLRFATHLVIFLRLACPEVMRGKSEECDRVITAYAQHLGLHQQVHAVPLYVGQIQDRATRIFTYSAFLQTVLRDDDRRQCVGLAQRYFPDDVFEAVRRTVEQSRLEDGESARPGLDQHVEGATVTRRDLEKLRALGWLNIDPAHAGEAVVQANLLLCDFVRSAMSGNVGAVEAAQLLIDRFLPEESVLFVERLAQQSAVVDVAGRAPHEWARELKAHLSWRALLQAYSSFDVWRSALAVSTLDPPPRAPAVGLAVGHQAIEASMIYKRTLKVWQEELQEKVDTLSRAAMLASAHLRNMLHFPRKPHLIEDDALAISLSAEQCKLIEGLGVEPSGWLEYGAGAGSRELIEMLRRQCLAQAVYMLHQVLHETAEWHQRFSQQGAARSWFAQAVAVESDLSEIFDLERILSVEQIAALRARFEESRSRITAAS